MRPLAKLFAEPKAGRCVSSVKSVKSVQSVQKQLVESVRQRSIRTNPPFAEQSSEQEARSQADDASCPVKPMPVLRLNPLSVDFRRLSRCHLLSGKLVKSSIKGNRLKKLAIRLAKLDHLLRGRCSACFSV